MGNLHQQTQFTSACRRRILGPGSPQYDCNIVRCQLPRPEPTCIYSGIDRQPTHVFARETRRTWLISRQQSLPDIIDSVQRNPWTDVASKIAMLSTCPLRAANVLGSVSLFPVVYLLPVTLS